jgi:type II secretion system protein N
VSRSEELLSPILYVVRNHKKTMLTSLVAAIIFSFIFFPYDDLSDLISELIAKNSQNQVFVQFDQLGIGFFPPALKMSKVSVDSPFVPTIKAKTLRLAPSIAGFLAFSPGFNASIEDFLKGDIEISYRAGKKVNDNLRLQKVSIDLAKVDLKKLSQFSSLPVDLEGQLSGEFNAQIDPGFTEQPDGEVEITIKQFRLPAATVPTPMGPMPLPETRLTNIKLRGQLKNGQLNIEEGLIGAPGDTLAGKFKGNIGLRLNRMGNQVVPSFSNYEFKIDINLDRSAEKNFGLFLSFYDRYKTVTGTGSRYAFRLTAPNTQVPPEANPLGSF